MDIIVKSIQRLPPKKFNKISFIALRKAFIGGAGEYYFRFIKSTDQVCKINNHPLQDPRFNNYLRALEDGLAPLKVLRVSLRLMREMHAKLIEMCTRESNPRRFSQYSKLDRPAGSALYNAIYVPLPVNETKLALNTLENFIHTNTMVLPALVQAGMIHYHFEVIHPILDGNGRVGRLLLILFLH